MEHALENAHGSGTVEDADVGTGLIEPLDPVRRHLPGVVRREREVSRSGAELGEDVVHRNAAVLRKPRLSVVKTAAVLLRNGLVVGRGCGHGAGDGVDHYLKQVTNGGKLAGIELIEQPVGMPFVHMLSLITAKGRGRAAATSVLLSIIRLCPSLPRCEISWSYGSFQYVGGRTLREVNARYLALDSAHATSPPWNCGISRPDEFDTHVWPLLIF